ncbi:hypothetical protein DL96DRAFT_902740 [Flagelloscypha sp. PMI_526]|nr:hypothetical protein DL96DRAFT_902740 [Flagelloscypha sp. PMI_526]
MATILEQPLSALRLVKGLAVHFGPPQLHSVGKVPQLALCMHITKLKKASEVYDEMTCLQAARDVVIVLQNLGLNYLEPTNYVLSPKSRIEWSAYNPDGRPNSMAVYCSENLHILSLDRSWDLKIASFTQLRAALLENQIPTREEIVSWLPSAAASFLLLLQYSLRAQVWGSHQRRHLLRLIQQVAVEHHPIPSVFELGGITADQHPFAGGGYADVYRALLPNKQPVCLKVLRVYFDLDNNGQDSQAKRTVIRAFFSEAVIWQQLTHPNVLPFLGVCYDAFPNRVCFVSPLMQHGDIMSFLKREFSTFEVRMAMVQCATD